VVALFYGVHHLLIALSQWGVGVQKCALWL